MTDHRNFPYTTIPTGWYQIGWSSDIERGSVTPLKYFDTDLVIARTESGALELFDAFCPHFGAHIGYGGRVYGETVECPYHGWRFDVGGKNCLIPYEDRPNNTALRMWHVVERYSVILAWYSSQGLDPQWEPVSIPEVEEGTKVAHIALREQWNIKMKPQFVTENLVDAAHQKYTHRGSDIPNLVHFESDGPVFRCFNTMVFGKGKAETWLTPDGEPRLAELNTEAWGMGLLPARFDIDGSITFQNTTPIDHETCDQRLTVFVPAEDIIDGQPTAGVMTRFRHNVKQTYRDIEVFDHMRYSYPTPFAPSERESFRALRNWAAQFYPEAAPGQFGRYATTQS